MFSDTKFWRLVWKEYRTHRALWLVTAAFPPLFDVMILVVARAFSRPPYGALGDEQASAMMAMGFIASVVYVLGCSATMFSVEHENATFDFQRVLPANHWRVLWAKVGFAAVSGLLLTFLLWLVIRGIILGFWIPDVLVWGSPKPSTWFGTYGLLYMAEVFAWSILASLLIRQPLWGVIVAIGLQSLVMQIVLPSLTSGRNDVFNLLNEDRRFLLSRFVVLALLIVADIIVGRLWFEDRLRLPRWRFHWKPDFAASYLSDVELPRYVGQRQIGWSRLLWLSWRDGRWVIAAVLIWYGYQFLTLRHPNDWEVLMLVSFISCFTFGLFAFAPEQWSIRFRFLTERGCSPRTEWLCRQVIWIVPMLLMSMGTVWKASQAQAHEHRIQEAALNAMLTTVFPLLCYSAGQLATMLFRSTVMAIAVGMGLCIAGGIWGALMTSWLVPTWWAVGSLPVIGLFVTWLKANDWIEERRDRVARWRLALGLGIPVVLLLATCATYRVVQIPAVTLPREWDDAAVVLARFTPAEQETLDIYRRAMSEIERGEGQLETYAARSARLKQEHPDWTDMQFHIEAFDGFHRDWMLQHVAVVPLLREAHKKPPVPMALVEADLPPRATDEWNPERTAKLTWLMIWHAEHSLKFGDLDKTWDDIQIAFELRRRSNLRAIPVQELFVNRMSSHHEVYLLATVAKWGRHKEQTRDRILPAIRKLEEIAADRTSIQCAVHHELLQAQEMLKLGEAWKKYVDQLGRYYRPWYAESSFLTSVWKAMFWERWRSDRVVRWQSSLALERADLLGRILKANRPLPLFANSSFRSAQDLAIVAEFMLPEERAKLLALGNYDRNSTQGAILETTLVPPNMHWGVSGIVESEFLKRAEPFRATVLLLALADFHRERGRYPETLSELVPTYFAEAPRDPNSAGPFVYFPHGVPDDVTQGTDNQDRVMLEKGIPFLMTMGDGNASSRSRQKPDGSWEFTNLNGKPISLSETLRSARVWRLEKTPNGNE